MPNFPRVFDLEGKARDWFWLQEFAGPLQYSPVRDREHWELTEVHCTERNCIWVQTIDESGLPISREVISARESVSLFEDILRPEPWYWTVTHGWARCEMQLTRRPSLAIPGKISVHVLSSLPSDVIGGLGITPDGWGPLELVFQKAGNPVQMEILRLLKTNLMKESIPNAY